MQRPLQRRRPRQRLRPRLLRLNDDGDYDVDDGDDCGNLVASTTIAATWWLRPRQRLRPRLLRLNDDGDSAGGGAYASGRPGAGGPRQSWSGPLPWPSALRSWWGGSLAVFSGLGFPRPGLDFFLDWNSRRLSRIGKSLRIAGLAFPDWLRIGFNYPDEPSGELECWNAAGAQNLLWLLNSSLGG